MRAGVRWTPGRRLARLRVVFGLPFVLLAGVHAWRLAEKAAVFGALELPAHMRLLDPTAVSALTVAGVALAAFFVLLCLVERLLDRVQAKSRSSFRDVGLRPRDE